MGFEEVRVSELEVVGRLRVEMNMWPFYALWFRTFIFLSSSTFFATKLRPITKVEGGKLDSPQV